MRRFGARGAGADFWVPVVLLVFGCVVIFELLETGGSTIFRNVSTATLPLVVAVVVGALASMQLVLLVWRHWRHGARDFARGSESQAVRRPQGRAATIPANWPWVMVVVISVMYVVVMRLVGYLPATIVYLMVLSAIYGNRSIRRFAMLAVVPFLIWLFFERYMLVLLPSASWAG